MKDVTTAFISARKQHVYRDTAEFEVRAYSWMENTPELRPSHHYEKGEGWLWYSGIAMVSTRIALAFVREEYADCFPGAEIVAVKDFDRKVWSIDLKRLRSEVPEIVWAACEEAVDSKKFSIKDLYYATV